MATESLIASSLDNFCDGADIKVTDRSHPHYGKTGKLVRFQKYGPNNIFSGWLVAEGDASSFFAKREQMKVI